MISFVFRQYLNSPAIIDEAVPHLNYHHLRYFWAIAHAGTLTKAAAQLNLSQSAVSVQLGKLEAQIGHRLFERSGKRLLLTEAGRIALDYADTVFDAGQELLSTLAGRPVATRQALRVGALATLSRNFQMEFLRPLVSRADVALVVRSGSMTELIARLDAHAIDVVLANSAVRLDSRSDLRSHLLRRQPVSLVGRPSRTRLRFRFPRDLAGVPIVLPSTDSGVRIAFDRILESAGIQPIIRAEIDDMAMIRVMARESDGVTLVPPIVVRDELSAGTLVEYCLVPDVEERFYAIAQRRRFPNPIVTELLSYAISQRR
jgi:LysR family transcriptional activator of nhaA